MILNKTIPQNYSGQINQIRSKSKKNIAFGFHPEELTKAVEANQFRLPEESMRPLLSVSKYFEAVNSKLPKGWSFNLNTRNLIPQKLQNIKAYRAKLPDVAKWMEKKTISPGKRNGDVVSDFAESFGLKKPNVIEI